MNKEYLFEKKVKVIFKLFVLYYPILNFVANLFFAEKRFNLGINS